MNDLNYGRIEQSWTVWCGRCGEWDIYSTRLKSKATKEFKRSKWTLSKELGWRCPKCSKKQFSQD